MATWNERIDNLQARLANLVSEEFAGANFYNTNIAVSDYNPTIDTTVTLTITVTNAEGDPVEDASVPVTASEGQFTKLNNTTITAASSVTGTTNSSGQFTLTYSCTEWGLITFSAKNHIHLQIRVTGYKLIKSTTNDLIKLYRNDNQIQCVLFSSNDDVYFGTSWTNYVNEGWIPTGLTPKSAIVATNYNHLNTFWVVRGNGAISKRTTNSAAVTTSSYVVIEWTV